MEVFKEPKNNILECSSSNNNKSTTTLVVGIVDQEPLLEISLLSPSEPAVVSSSSLDQQGQVISDPAAPQTESTALFAQKLQMRLKSHLETSASSDSSSSDEFFSNSSATEDTTTTSSGNNSEIFYDFDDVVYDEELVTSDYGTGGSNSTVVASRSSSGSSSSGSSVVAEDQDKEQNNRNNNNVASANVRYQRSSSLKSGKTPPGTPMKKIVRFADAMGLDLTDIKVFLDEIPKVPKEAYRDLHIPDYTGPSSNSSGVCSLSNDFGRLSLFSTPVAKGNLNFVPLFHQPVTMPDFFDKIRDKKVLLENAYLTQETIMRNTQEGLSSTSSSGSSSSSSSLVQQVIKGTVRVMNLDFHKSVYIRYTYNDWKEFVDFQATYMSGSCDGFSDRFEFRIDIDESKLPPPYVREHDDAKVQFACRFHCQGNQFWDNNQGRNYVFQNVPTPRSSIAAAWDDNFIADFATTTTKPPPMIPEPTNTTSKTTTTTTTPPNSNNNNNSSSLLPTTTDPLFSADKITSYTSAPGGGGGSHLSSSLYSPSSVSSMSFYDTAYGSSYQFGSACFY